MKLTLNVDEELLVRAQAIAGGKSKTATIDLALRDFVRRGSLLAALEEAAEISPDEWAAALDPAYDLMASRTAETSSLYGRKPRPRRQ